jgi:hypothetical protein
MCEALGLISSTVGKKWTEIFRIDKNKQHHAAIRNLQKAHYIQTSSVKTKNWKKINHELNNKMRA